ALAGYRMLGLNDSLSITENLATQSSGVPAALAITDRFTTSNRFYGAQVGVDGEWHFGDFYVGGRAKVGLGTTQELVTINGVTNLAVAGFAPQTASGGLLALAGSNIGHRSHDMFTVV